MKFPKEQLFLAIFFLLWGVNCVGSHLIAKPFMQAAEELSRSTANVEQKTALARQDHRLGQGVSLLVLNLPLFIGLGFFVRAAEPAMGPLYWTLVVGGSFYLPLFATLCLFFTFHAPKGPRGFPGVDVDDGSLRGEDDPDDER